MTAQLYDLTITLTPETDADLIIAPAGASGAGTDSQLVLTLTAFYSGAGGLGPQVQAYTNVTLQVVTHNLGRYPLVQVLNNFMFQVDSQVQHLNTNEFIVTFNAAESGTILYY